jgi:CitMHS family citrate-Mg2+:H+ or citrate-Ca2+:H+ symporter
LGLLVGLVFAWYLGMKETKRLKGSNTEEIDIDTLLAASKQSTPEEEALKRPKLIAPNLLLIVIIIGIMIADLVPPATAFMIGTAIAMVINYPNAKIQRERVDAHAMEAMLMASVLFAAGVLMGILKGSGMAAAMAKAMVSIIPAGSGSIITLATGYLSVPMSLVFDPDSYYFGVMPVIAESVKAFGVPAVDIARASICGQITVGFPISPLTPSTFLLIGLSGVELGDHQKFTFKYLFAISCVIMTVMILMGLFTL